MNEEFVINVKINITMIFLSIEYLQHEILIIIIINFKLFLIDLNFMLKITNY